MKSIVRVLKFNEIEENEIGINEEKQDVLGFHVYLIDEIKDELSIGSYYVFENGSVACDIDDYIFVHKKDLLSKVQNILLNNGLKEIMNLEINDDELFKGLLSETYTFFPDKSRYTRAKKYIKNNNIEVENINILDYVK